jgi:hypothetical protein
MAAISCPVERLASTAQFDFFFTTMWVARGLLWAAITILALIASS